jgi:glycosyltransferase involved in cell wall biosynthesis
MRIGFDIRPFLKQETGVGVYFKNLLIELASLDFENEYYLFSASWKDRFDRSKIPTFKKGGFRDVRWPVNAVNFLWYKLGRPRLDSVFKTDLDLTHSPTPIILPTKGKKIVTVCDLFFMDFPGKADRQARTHFLRGTKRSLEVADGVLTISEFTKKALIERFGLGENKIKVTYLGLNRVYLETAAGRGELEAARRALDLPPEYLLFVGATEPRKNLLNLIDALALVHQRYKRIPLVLIGRKGEDHNNLLARIAARDLGPWIKILGYRPDRELRYFYQAASAFILPSFCEGFGLPLIEAMACGVPVVVSGTTAMPEVAGEAASYFNPESPEDMAGQIIHVLKDKGLRHNLIQKGWTRALDFRWEKTAAETLGFYRSVTERK